MNPSGEALQGEPDPSEDGYRLLKDLGHPVSDIYAASAGFNEMTSEQILVFGSTYVQILSPAGAVLLDVGDRDVRGVRRLQGVGVEVWVDPFSQGGYFPSSRWLHCTTEADATHLEDFWLRRPRVTHAGVQLSRLHHREDDFAYFVGRVITAGAKCDLSLAALAQAGYRILERKTDGILNQSGYTLADILMSLGRRSPAVSEMAERYKAWYEWRNFAVHGIREIDDSDHATDRVVKLEKGSNVIVETREQDFEMLALMWNAFHSLDIDARRASLHLRTSGGTKHALRNIPRSNTVAELGRLPPKQ